MSKQIWTRGRGLAPDIVAALEGTGLDWDVVIGTKHRKIIVGGRLAGVLPLKSGGGQNQGRDGRNVIANIKRIGREK